MHYPGAGKSCFYQKESSCLHSGKADRKTMGGLTNGIGYVAAAITVGYLLKSTDYISYKIDER